MHYTRKHAELISFFRPDAEQLSTTGKGPGIVYSRFVSGNFSRNFFSGDDHSIRENQSFSYPVFVPEEAGSSKVILLLHGLNERSWEKYLAWAHCLSSKTGSYVILFPISFHINRSPLSWKDPRSMLQFLKESKGIRGEARSSSFANIAISNRLSDDPRRFLKSGYQTACDIAKLVRQIKNGLHPVVPGGGHIDIFAYSIGAFLAEILVMADPEGLFRESRLFMFCGGAVFSSMNGESRLIMDKLAYDKVYNYYLNLFEAEIGRKESLISIPVSGKIGMAFRAMIDFSRYRHLREKVLYRLRDRLYAVALMKDRVIPAAGIINTLDSGNVEVMDFPYDYTHENPFPIFSNDMSAEVDRSFDKVFDTACRFFD
ncbi:MAG: DUF6051 family protein [Bacteroidales bacterium]|nr:DUF6051 family protein [Bacteroidales bacterium]